MDSPLGICEYCNTQFSGAEEEIRQQFHSHKCERPDTDQQSSHPISVTCGDK